MLCLLEINLHQMLSKFIKYNLNYNCPLFSSAPSNILTLDYLSEWRQMGNDYLYVDIN